MAGSLPDEIDSRFFEHGGRLDVARAAFPNAPGPWIDLSTGISPWSFPMPHIEGEIQRQLPPVDVLQSLLTVARKAYKAPDATEIAATPGTDAGLSILPWLFREAKRVAVLAPAYSGHAVAWEAAAHSVSQIESLDRCGSAAIVIVVNPGNPDGRFTPFEALVEALPSIRRRNGLLIVDEAFADADQSQSLLPKVARLDHTLVLRSAGKFYGAGGVRLGFAITSHPIAQRLKAALGAWPLSAQALAFGQAALAHEAWAAAQRERLKAGASALDAILTATGFKIAGGTALFRFAEHPQSRGLFLSLACQGILTRPFRNQNALRFGLPAGEVELGRLREALGKA